jgi:hypothetical protein
MNKETPGMILPSIQVPYYIYDPFTFEDVRECVDEDVEFVAGEIMDSKKYYNFIFYDLAYLLICLFIIILFICYIHKFRYNSLVNKENLLQFFNL